MRPLYAVDANKSGQLARVKQREWKKSRYDRGGTRKQPQGLHPGLFSVAPIRSELTQEEGGGRGGKGGKGSRGGRGREGWVGMPGCPACGHCTPWMQTKRTARASETARMEKESIRSRWRPQVQAQGLHLGYFLSLRSDRSFLPPDQVGALAQEEKEVEEV
jgi:hypothetical protein